MPLATRAFARSAQVLLIACACLVAGGLLASPALANTPASGLGMNAWYLFYEMPQSSWPAQLAAMQADGIRVVRADANWDYVQPNPPTAAGPGYDWNYMDSIVASLAAHDMRWLPIVDYSTTWSESVPGDLQSPPTSDADYAEFAAAVVARYGPNGAFWAANPQLTPEPVTQVEIWNEENIAETWGGTVNAARYAAMYAAARTAIHAVNPSVEAIVGGLGNPANTYLDEMYQTLGGPGQIDAVADHPYDLTPQDTLDDVAELRWALDQEGDTNVPIDVTEFGWPTEGSATWVSTVSDATRAQYMTQTIDDLATSDCGVEGIDPYAWSTAQSDPTNTDDWFGVTNDGAATATSAAIAQAYETIESKPEPSSATTDMCGRPLYLELAQVSPPSGSTDNLCVQASVLSWGPGGYASVGITGATVRFTAPSAQTVTTGANGTATACWSLPAATAASIAATASQPQFTPVPSATLSATTPAATPAPSTSTAPVRPTSSSSTPKTSPAKAPSVKAPSVKAAARLHTIRHRRTRRRRRRRRR